MTTSVPDMSWVIWKGLCCVFFLPQWWALTAVWLPLIGGAGAAVLGACRPEGKGLTHPGSERCLATLSNPPPASSCSCSSPPHLCSLTKTEVQGCCSAWCKDCNIDWDQIVNEHCDALQLPLFCWQVEGLTCTFKGNLFNCLILDLIHGSMGSARWQTQISLVSAFSVS